MATTWQHDVNYSDARYGVEKILTLAPVTMSAAVGNKVWIPLTEDIEILEVGLWVTTKMSGAAAGSFVLKESAGGGVIATISCPSDTAVGVTLAASGTSIGSCTALVSGVILVANVATSISIGGVVSPYIKYRALEYDGK